MLTLVTLFEAENYHTRDKNAPLVPKEPATRIYG